MRRIAVLPLALIMAACQDQPTGPEPGDGPSLAAAKKEPAVAPITVIASPPRSLGYTQGDVFRYHNRPEPDLGGDRVVWRHMENPYYGSVNVFQAHLPGGATTRLAELGTYAGPHTSGRYTTWQDGETGIMLLDNVTGQRRRIEGTQPFAGSVDIAGDKLAYLDLGTQAIMVYDIPTGARLTVALWGPAVTYHYVRGMGFDGRYVAWISDGARGESGLGLVVNDIVTGREIVAVPFGQGSMSGPSVDRGRVVFSMQVGDRESVFLYDIASGTTRRISDAPGRQTNPEISGDLIVWDDTRQDNNPAYVFNHDVYLYDLKAGVETPLANDATWSGDPQVDGSRVVWTERRNNRWEVLVVDLVPVSLPALRDELRRMTASGAVRSAGVARSLDAFLSQATAAQSAGNRARAADRLRQFAAHVRQHAGKQIEASAARRLEGLAAGVIARL
ncbi:MAG TPA: hypothetical protein VEQ60_19965 [Longimicrobium sp.]|nr:hypothetical protein [Longimicrobium sp.]